jgi:hypothetical protein
LQRRVGNAAAKIRFIIRIEEAETNITGGVTGIVRATRHIFPVAVWSHRLWFNHSWIPRRLLA